MAEYIGRDDVLRCRETITTDDYSGNETIDVVAVEEILEITPADVVERSMYEQLCEEANAFSKAYLKEREKYKQLKLNIDKSVKEIEQYLLEVELANKNITICLEPEDFERSWIEVIS